jgi:DNA-binding LytR/AlgR family response regulator
MTISFNTKSCPDIQSSQIVMLRGDINYTIIYLNDGKKIMNSHTLKVYEKKLSAEGFLRVHRAYLVNPIFLSSFDMNKKSVLMKNGMKAEVSRRKTAILKGFMRSESYFAFRAAQ